MTVQRVLVTGGAGYIGSILVPKLLEHGFHVTVVDNFMFGQDSLSGVCYHPCFELVRGDARDHDVMRPLLKTADIIIPLAALVGAPLCDRDPLAATSTNKDAVVWMAGALARDQRIVIPISNSGYGVGEAGKFCTEETPMRPVSLYGRDKVETERAVLEMHPNTISLRLATVFGMSPRMRLDLLGQRLHLPRVPRSVHHPVRGALQAELPARPRRGQCVPARDRQFRDDEGGAV